MPYTQINVTMELVSSFVVAILMFSQLGKAEKTRQDWLFLLMLGAHMVCTLSDAVNWAFDTWPGSFYRSLTLTGNFLSYFVSALGYIPFILYVMAAASKRGRVAGNTFRAACAVSGAMILLSVLNLFNGMLYTIDQDNIFHWGDWDWFFNVLVFVQLILSFVQILSCRHELDRRDVRTFMVYEILPILAILFSLFPIELTLVYPATMLSLLLLYVNVQQEQERRLALRELELAESRTAVMISQIQPHFLYNALLAVEDLCETDPPGARKAVNDFAKYLRGNLRALTEKEPIPFSDELVHIRHYLVLEQVRFGEKLKLIFQIGPTDFWVPALSVQPIVENAVKHGVTCRRAGGTVILRTLETPEAWLVVVEDDGVGFDPSVPVRDGREHVGLANVRNRLAAMVDGTLEIESAPGEGTRVKMILPKEVRA